MVSLLHYFSLPIPLTLLTTITFDQHHKSKNKKKKKMMMSSNTVQIKTEPIDPIDPDCLADSTDTIDQLIADAQIKSEPGTCSAPCLIQRQPAFTASASSLSSSTITPMYTSQSLIEMTQIDQRSLPLSNALLPVVSSFDTTMSSYAYSLPITSQDDSSAAITLPYDVFSVEHHQHPHHTHYLNSQYYHHADHQSSSLLGDLCASSIGTFDLIGSVPSMSPDHGIGMSDISSPESSDDSIETKSIRLKSKGCKKGKRKVESTASKPIDFFNSLTSFAQSAQAATNDWPQPNSGQRTCEPLDIDHLVPYMDMIPHELFDAFPLMMTDSSGEPIHHSNDAAFDCGLSSSAFSTTSSSSSSASASPSSSLTCNSPHPLSNIDTVTPSTPSSVVAGGPAKSAGRIRWKKLLKNQSLTADDLERRRNLANKQERRRMLKLNKALDQLREVIPGDFVQKHEPRILAPKKLSKIKTLRIAIEYIAHLSHILNQP